MNNFKRFLHTWQEKYRAKEINLIGSEVREKLNNYVIRNQQPEPNSEEEPRLVAIGQQQVQDRTYFEYTDIVVQLIESGCPNNAPHPWLDLFVADSKIDSFASQTIAKLDPALFLPGSIMLFYPFVKSRLKRPLFRTPYERMFFLFDILRTVPSDAAALKGVLAENRNLYEQNRALDGSFYTISAIQMKYQDWKKHFEPFWNQLMRAKRKYDPAILLGAGTSVFT